MLEPSKLHTRYASAQNRIWNAYLWRIVGVVLSLITIFLVDYYFSIAVPRLIVVAVLDEVAHALTAVIVLLALWRAVNIWLASGCFAGAVLIDIDHLPAMFDTGSFALHPDRPVTHSLVSAIFLVIVATVISGRSRAFLFGAALGVATHLLRDMATGGVPLFWPITVETVEVRYRVYATLLILLAVVPAAHYFLCSIRSGISSPFVREHSAKSLTRSQRQALSDEANSE